MERGIEGGISARTAHCNRRSSAYCIPCVAHGVHVDEPVLGAIASGAQAMHAAAASELADARPATHTFPTPSVPPGVFAKNTHAVKIAACMSLTCPNPPVAFASFDENVHSQNVGEFTIARNAPPTPSTARFAVNAVRFTSVRTSLLK